MKRIFIFLALALLVMSSASAVDKTFRVTLAAAPADAVNTVVSWKSGSGAVTYATNTMPASITTNEYVRDVSNGNSVSCRVHYTNAVGAGPSADCPAVTVEALPTPPTTAPVILNLEIID